MSAARLLVTSSGVTVPLPWRLGCSSRPTLTTETVPAYLLRVPLLFPVFANRPSVFNWQVMLPHSIKEMILNSSRLAFCIV